MKKLFLLLAPFIVSLFCISSASAVSVTQTYNNYIQRYYQGEPVVYGPVSVGTVNIQSNVWNYPSGVRIGRWQFSVPTSINNLSEYTQIDIDFQVRVLNINGQSTSFSSVVPTLSANYGEFDTGSCSSYDFGRVSGSSLSYQSYHCTYYTSNTANISSLWVNFGSANTGDSTNNAVSLSYNAYVQFLDYSYQSSLSPSSQAIISAITNSNQTIINQNNITNNLLEQQNQQQQSQYESEKEEELQREQSAQDSQSGNFLGSIGNIIFPFATMFTTLGTQACFTPTTLNSWLHVTGQSCPLFPASVTSAVSSVALVLGSIIVFGFVIRWLNSKENI